MHPRLTSLLTALALVPLAALAASSARALPPDDDASAKVTIIAISDFQCPFCGRADPTLDDLYKRYGKALSVHFVHNPLPFHQNAVPAAKAAEAARRQGKFEAFATKLFANQQALAPEDFERYAAELGLDVARFKADSADQAVADKITHEQAIANAIGATGTPAFYINGLSLRGAQPIEEFEKIIDGEVALADQAHRSGPQWVAERLKTNHADLSDYLAGVRQPVAPAPTKPAVDKSVYRVTVDEKVDAITGSPTALVTMVVFSDFQCPFCKKLEPTIAQLQKDYGDKLRIVFKNNPLPFHKDAYPAAVAALCAKDQGKFWPMHDRLFASQEALTAEGLAEHATAVGLDMKKWKKCVAGTTHKAQIEADQKLAGEVTARGTPNSYINGRKLVGAKPIEEFKEAIDDALTEAEAKVAAGTAPRDLYKALIKDGKVFEVLESTVSAFNETRAPILGKASAPIHVVVVSDLQCPFCSRLAPVLVDLEAKYRGKVAIVWKNFPLSFHQQAMPAAKAAMCAHEQGKFWEAERWMYENQKELEEQLGNLAQAVGLDGGKLAACIASERPGTVIEADMAEAHTAEVRGTPTVFINGRKFNSPSGYNLEAFDAAIDLLTKPKAK